MSKNSQMQSELTRSARFLGVSFISAFSNLVYVVALKHFTSMPFWLISATSTEFSMIINFVLNDRFTFRNLSNRYKWYTRLLRFQLAALGGNLLTVAISTFLFEVLIINALFSQAIAILITFFFNYLIHRFWTFNGGIVEEKANFQEIVQRYAVTFKFDGVSVVVPVRNEVQTIEPLMQRLQQTLTNMNTNYEIIVVDDRSTDGTFNEAKRVAESNNIPTQILVKQGKVGKSYSLIEGFAAAKYQVLAMIDGDLELPPEALAPMITMLNQYDIIVGKRLNYDRDNEWRGKIGRLFYTFVLRYFLGIPYQVQAGIKVFWKYAYDSFEIHPGKWGFDLEFIAKAMADEFRIGEYPVAFEKRQFGLSKVNVIAVATELLTSAVKIKFDILQMDKVNTIKSSAVKRSAPNARAIALNWLIPGIIIFAYLKILMGPAFLSSTDYIGVAGDPYQYMWFIGWFWHAISLHQPIFISSSFDYPGKINIMDYTSVPVIGLLFGWLYAFFSVQLVFNIIFMVNFALIFIFGKLTLQELRISSFFSTIGGMLFCLLPYFAGQDLGHLNLYFVAPHFAVGYILVRIFQAKRKPTIVEGFLLGIAVVCIFYTSLETFTTLFLCIFILFIFTLIFLPKFLFQKTKNLVDIKFVGGFILPLLLIIPGIINFIQGQTGGGFTSNGLSSIYVNDMYSFFIPTNMYLLHNVSTSQFSGLFRGGVVEENGYLSLPFIFLVGVYTIVNWNKKFVRVFVCSAIFIAILSLGPHLIIAGRVTHLPLPWTLALKIPLLDVLLPSRLGLYVAYLTVIVVIYGADTYFKRYLFNKPVDLAFNVLSLLLVIAFWLPVIPFNHMTLPSVSQIVNGNNITSTYLSNEPTLVLYDNDPTIFDNVMGVLAASKDYDIPISNVYGYDLWSSPGYFINQSLISKNLVSFKQLLQQYVPSTKVKKVIFMSLDDQPMDQQFVTAASQYMGQPIYNNGGLVIVWNSPNTTP